MLAAGGAGAALAAWQLLSGPAQHVAADSGADSTLFSLTNQDRASNGVGALQWLGSAGSIAEGQAYGGCGFTVYGRSVDMIQRQYFSHQILNCGGQLVFNMLNANGVGYRSAGENIGWAGNAGGSGASATYVNNAFMNSPGHRANILNGSFTHMGVGSASASSWMSSSNVWMFTEVFVQLNGSPPPPPPPPHPAAPPTQPPVRNDVAPTPQGPAVTPAPTATPEPTPEPVVLPPVPPANQPPLLWVSRGLLTDSIESMLEGALL